MLEIKNLQQHDYLEYIGLKVDYFDPFIEYPVKLESGVLGIYCREKFIPVKELKLGDWKFKRNEISDLKSVNENAVIKIKEFKEENKKLKEDIDSLLRENADLYKLFDSLNIQVCKSNQGLIQNKKYKKKNSDLMETIDLLNAENKLLHLKIKRFISSLASSLEEANKGS